MKSESGVFFLCVIEDSFYLCRINFMKIPKKWIGLFRLGKYTQVPRAARFINTAIAAVLLG
jgi:hypothetical protein